MQRGEVQPAPERQRPIGATPRKQLEASPGSRGTPLCRAGLLERARERLPGISCERQGSAVTVGGVADCDGARVARGLEALAGAVAVAGLTPVCVGVLSMSHVLRSLAYEIPR
jgi:hypothetical protein